MLGARPGPAHPLISSLLAMPFTPPQTPLPRSGFVHGREAEAGVSVVVLPLGGNGQLSQPAHRTSGSPSTPDIAAYNRRCLPPGGESKHLTPNVGIPLAPPTIRAEVPKVYLVPAGSLPAGFLTSSNSH